MAEKYLISKEIDSKYLGDNVKQFPDWRIDPNKKHEGEYCQKVSEAMFSIHLQGKTGIPLLMSTEFNENRLYGASKQPVSIYMDKLLTNKKKDQAQDQFDNFDPDKSNNRESKKEGWMNVYWRVLSIMDKCKNWFHGVYDQAEYDITARAVDQESGAEREQMELFSRVYSHFSEHIKILEELAGVTGAPPEFIPTDEASEILFQNAGGFKLPHEIKIEELIQHTLDISDYSDTMKPKWLDDMIDIGIIAAKQYYDEIEHKYKWRYVDPDPSNFIIQYSKTWDYSDAEYAGEIIWEKVSNLRGKIFPGDPDKEFIELQKYAKQFCGLNSNPISWDYYAKYNQSTWFFDDFRIPVFHANWIDSDTENKLIFTTLHGYSRVRDLGWDEQPSKRTLSRWKGITEDGVEPITTNLSRLYKCSWLIGTDVCYDYGLETYQPYPPKLPFRCRKITTNPITKTLIPFIDQINLAWFKWQNMIAQMRMDGIMFNQDMLDNISLKGGDILEPEDQFTMFIQSGIGAFRTLDGEGNFNSGSSSPFIHIPGGMGKAFEEIIKTMDICYAKIQETTGISDVLMGSTPAPRTGNGNVEAAMNGGLNVSKPVINTIMLLKQDIADISADALCTLFKVDEEACKAYEDVIGKWGVEIMKIASSHVKYGTKLEARPTDQDWARLYNWINIAVQANPNFIGAAIKLDRLRASRYSYKQISTMLEYEITKERAAAAQQQQAAIKQQTDGNMQLEQTKQQAKQQDQQHEMAMAGQEIQGKKDIKQMGSREKAQLLFLKKELGN
jgi:hypothetical protein